MKNPLLVNVLSFILINLIPQFSGFILLKVYTDNLSISEYGILGILNTIPPMLAIFITLQLQSTISRFYVEYEGEEQKNVVGAILGLSFLVNIVLTSVAIIFNEQFTSLLFKDELAGYDSEIVLAIFAASVSGFIAPLQAILIIKEQAAKILKRISIISIFVAFVQFLSIEFYSGKVYEILLITLFGLIFNLLLLYMQVKEEFYLSVEKTITSKAAKYSSPLIFHQIGGYLFNFSSLILIARYLGVESVALFALLSKLSSILKIIVNSINTAWQPRFFKKMKEGSKYADEFTDASIKFSSFVLVATYFFLVLFLSLLLLNVFDGKYHNVLMYIPIMMGAYLVRMEYCFKIALIFYNKNTQLIPLITLAGGIFNVVFALYFVQKLELTAFVLSFYLSYLVMFCMAYLIERKKYNRKSKSLIVLSVFVTILATLQNYYLEDWLVYLFFGYYFIVLVVVLAFRRRLLSLFRFSLEKLN